MFDGAEFLEAGEAEAEVGLGEGGKVDVVGECGSVSRSTNGDRSAVG